VILCQPLTFTDWCQEHVCHLNRTLAITYHQQHDIHFPVTLLEWITYQWGDSTSHVVEHLTCVSTVVSLNPGHAKLSGYNLGQVVHTHSPSRSQWSSSNEPMARKNPGLNHTTGGSVDRDKRWSRQPLWYAAAAPLLQCLGRLKPLRR